MHGAQRKAPGWQESILPQMPSIAGYLVPWGGWAGCQGGRGQVRSTSSQPQVNLNSCWMCRSRAAAAPRLSAGWRDGQRRWELRSHGHRTHGRFHVQSSHLSCCKCDHKVRTDAIWPEDTMTFIIEVVMSEVRELRLHDQRGHRGNPMYL